jgi:hypothetical protein
MSKMYEGKHKDKDGWQLLGDVGFYDGVNWVAYKRDGEREWKDWRDIKVAAQGMAPHKANYWTAWNGTRLAGSLCLKQMAEHRSDLLEGLTTFMKKITDNVD